MAELTKQEIIDLFNLFINERGLFYDFKDFIENQGYSLTELGMDEY